MSTLWDFINERHAIYLRKTLLERTYPPDWACPDKRWMPGSNWTLDKLTDDPILAEYRFCNVFRELDRVTEWIRVHIREPYADHPHLWYMLMIARELNWPPALEELMKHASWPDRNRGFSPHYITEALTMMSQAGKKWHTGAYMIQAPNKSWAPGVSKMEYVGEWVLGKPWRDRDHWEFALTPGATLQGIHTLLTKMEGYYGWGPFMAYEWVTDLRHTRYLRGAPDIMAWANAGPGAIRGLNRIFGRDLKTKPSADVLLAEMVWLLQKSPEELKAHVPHLELRDIEHALCEFDKYERVRLGQGRPRAKYVRGRGY